MPILAELKRLREAAHRLLELMTQDRRDRQLAPIVKELERQLRGYFGEQWRLFKAELDAVKDTYPQMEALRADEFAEWWWEWVEWEGLLARAMASSRIALISPVDEAVAAAYLMAGRTAIADLGIGISFNLRNPRAISFLENYGADLVTKIEDATRNYIHDVLVKGRNEGWSYDKVARAITERYADFAVGRPQEHIRSRAHLIAVQETAEAYGQANLDVAMELEEGGLPMEKKWAASPDERTCEICLGNAAEGWIPSTEAFPSGHQREPAHVACRCNVQYQRMKSAA